MANPVYKATFGAVEVKRSSKRIFTYAYAFNVVDAADASTLKTGSIHFGGFTSSTESECRRAAQSRANGITKSTGAKLEVLVAPVTIA